MWLKKSPEVLFTKADLGAHPALRSQLSGGKARESGSDAGGAQNPGLGQLVFPFLVD